MGNYTFEHLNSINLKHYSQTVNAGSKQILIHYLTRPATTFFDSQMKETPLKQ